MNNKTIYTIGGVIVGLTFTYFGYNIYRAYRNKKLAEQGEVVEVGDDFGGSVGTGQQISNEPKPSKDGLPLKVGDYGFKVALLQSALKHLGSGISVDGKFGEQTYKAILQNSDEWSFVCKIGYACTLNKDEFESILKKAESEGWDKSVANDKVANDWMKFASGDDYAFKNIFN